MNQLLSLQRATTDTLMIAFSRPEELSTYLPQAEHFAADTASAWLDLVERIFAARPETGRLLFEFPSQLVDAGRVNAFGLFDSVRRKQNGHIEAGIDQHEFWQRPGLWMEKSSDAEAPQGCLYRRYLPSMKGWFEIHAADIDAHSGVLNRWMNDERVAHFWDMKGPEQVHRDYLQSCAEDPHTQSTIIYLKGRPVAYAEFYWAADDKLAAHYDADPYDRGLHCLIGDWRLRTNRMIQALIGSCSHYMFLDDIRTQRVVGEPRADHTHYIQRLVDMGFFKAKEFDFPHKRAALVCCDRETFFSTFHG